MIKLSPEEIAPIKVAQADHFEQLAYDMRSSGTVLFRELASMVNDYNTELQTIVQNPLANFYSLDPEQIEQVKVLNIRKNELLNLLNYLNPESLMDRARALRKDADELAQGNSLEAVY